MVSADENTPVRGSGKGKKADAPGKKSAKRASKARQKATTADPLPETQALEAQELRQEPREEPGDAPVAPAESFAILFGLQRWRRFRTVAKNVQARNAPVFACVVGCPGNFVFCS